MFQGSSVSVRQQCSLHTHWHCRSMTACERPWYAGLCSVWLRPYVLVRTARKDHGVPCLKERWWLQLTSSPPLRFPTRRTLMCFWPSAKCCTPHGRMLFSCMKYSARWVGQSSTKHQPVHIEQWWEMPAFVLDTQLVCLLEPTQFQSCRFDAIQRVKARQAKLDTRNL